MISALANYHALVQRVDELCQRIWEQFPAAIVCRAGCDGCCRHLSLFWVEAMALAAAVGRLPAEQALLIRRKAAIASEGSCPLLHEGLCLLYAARPLICRTHGLPLVTGTEGNRSIDFCPLNFLGIETLPGGAVVDLDRLNTALAAINALFVSEYFGSTPPPKERSTIAEALLIEF